MTFRLAPGLTLAVLLTVGACAPEGTVLPASQTVGPTPQIPPPSKKALIPTIKVPTASSWAEGAAPTPAPGFVVNRFADGLDHPRWLHVLPNGDVLVALSATKPEPPKSIRSFFQTLVMKKVGSVKDSADQVVLLRDADGDGVAEVRSIMIAGLNQPFGIALHGGQLYVANTDALVRFPYREGDRALSMPSEKVIDLPHGPGHWTRNVIPAADGRTLLVTVGSASNIADGGMAQEEGRAAIWSVDPSTRKGRIFASGLRNANGLAYEPTSGLLYTVVNERDELGDDLSPDYLTSVADGDWYGWPWFYWGDHQDRRVPVPANVRLRPGKTPDYSLGAHVAPLGLAFYTGQTFPQNWREGAYIGEHGSWNRSVYSGYKVVFVPFAGGKPSGPPRDFLTGFFSAKNKVAGRPVGVGVAADGAVLVADDVGGVIWRVAPAASAPVTNPAPSAP